MHAVVNVSLRPRFGAAHWSVTAFAWSTMSNCDVIDEIGITPPENVRATTPVKSLDKAALDPSLILCLQVTQLMPIVLFILCFYLLKYSKIYVLTTSSSRDTRAENRQSDTLIAIRRCHTQSRSINLSCFSDRHGVYTCAWIDPVTCNIKGGSAGVKRKNRTARVIS